MGLRVTYMGTPDFAVSALQALIDSEHEVICVYTQPPRPKGRGHQVQKSPVHLLAEVHGIEVRYPVSFKKEPEAITEFEALDHDVAVVAAYGLILPQAVLDAPRYGCLNIHGSLLQRWRGAAPIQRSIWAGDDETGITIMQMEAGLDTGPMILKDRVAITGETTASTLHDALASMGARLIVEALDRLEADGELIGDVQDDALSNYASMLSRDDGQIDWSLPAEEIDRQVRALTPWPGCWCVTQDGKRLKIHQTSLSAQTSDKGAGTILDRKGHIACGGGTVLKLEEIQPENAKRMDSASAVNGGYLEVNSLM